MAFELTPERSKRLDDIVGHYPNAMAATLPALRIVQEEVGWVPLDGMRWIAARLGVSLAHVESVASFYTLYHKEPVGKHVVQVCRTLSCAMRGGGRLLERCKERLGVDVGGTAGDVTLETAECLAACGTAPVLTVNDEFHENMTVEKLDRLLDSLGAKR
jgi:NADH-quinone oxidoreductase subunit E